MHSIREPGTEGARRVQWFHPDGQGFTPQPSCSWVREARTALNGAGGVEGAVTAWGRFKFGQGLSRDGQNSEDAGLIGTTQGVAALGGEFGVPGFGGPSSAPDLREAWGGRPPAEVAGCRSLGRGRLAGPQVGVKTGG